MTVNSFINLRKNYKTGAFRWHVVELYLLWLVSERQSWPMKTEADEIARLKYQLAQVEKLLHEEKLKRAAAKTMITIAEKELNIAIRKKSGRSRSADAGVPPKR